MTVRQVTCPCCAMKQPPGLVCLQCDCLLDALVPPPWLSAKPPKKPRSPADDHR